MEINRSSNVKASNSDYNAKQKVNEKVKPGEFHEDETSAAVYEKTIPGKEGKPATYSRDQVTIERLKEEAERRTQELRNLVEKMLLKQGYTLTESDDMYALLREGKVEVDPETRAQAQKDIAEDGYWGIEQTSERLVSFAKAVSGNDPSKADLMISAIKDGFEQATKTWGDELPKICKDTLEVTLKKLEDWKTSKC